MNYILVDPPSIERFYPFTLTRPFGEMRVFGGTIKEIWEKYLGCEVSYLTDPHLSDLYTINLSKKTDNIFIPAWYLPRYQATPFNAYKKSPEFDRSFLAVNLDWNKAFEAKQRDSNSFREYFAAEIILNSEFDSDNSINFSLPESYFNEWRPSVFFDMINLYLKDVHHHEITLNSNVNCSEHPFFNDDDGPIIIEEDVTIMEGAMIRGPVHICKGSTIKMGAKIYGPTVIGPYCKVGGEVSNCVFLGYSNKAHEGFLGHSIIGEWCNIGAGTSNSNLKNDYGTVKMWDYQAKKFKDSGHQFLGLYMGDHSKCAINTSFNTGTTVGVNCNIFGAGFPRNFIPSFSWGGAQGVKPYDFEKAISVAEIVMARRGVKLTPDYIDMLRSVHDITSKMK